MIQGYMLLTERHICFFAQLPRTNVHTPEDMTHIQDTVIKTGYLYKKSRNTLRRHRHWFVLKNDILSYYDDPAVSPLLLSSNCRISTFQAALSTSAMP
jgi:sterol 3beta-glucosyltransferase